MKKSNLWTGVGFVLAAVLCLLTVFLFETPLNSMFCGLTGAFGAPGLVLIYRYFKWNSPKHGAEYRERLELEQIELRDERNAMLRDKSGRYAYLFSLGVEVAVLFALSVAEILSRRGVYQTAVIALSVWIIVQYLAGILFYRMLKRKA